MKNIVLIIAVLFAIVVSASVGVVSPTNMDSVILLENKNTVNFRGVVDDMSVTKAILDIALLDVKRGSEDYPIYLVLDTPGGSISAGLNFIEYAKTVRNLKTISIFAASMGSAIVEQLPGERLVTSNGVLMFHRAAGRFEGQFNDGEVESQLKFWKSLVTDMEQKNADRMSISLQEYKDRSKDELWIYGKNNVSEKSADRVVSIKCSKQLMDDTETIAVQILFFTVDATYSKCPLLSNPINIEEQE